MKRSALVLACSVALSTLIVAAVGEREAAACGGCVVPPNQTASDITDERMLLAVSQKQSTLYDQIRYAGSPESFAWVLPIQGTVDVGLSADVLFASIDKLTTTTINPPKVTCPGLPVGCSTGRGGSDSVSGAASPVDPGEVIVLKQENVGPYATVQLKSTDPNALTQWLVDNGFQIKPDEKPILEQYVREGFDFLAMKLLPNKDVKSMRPVRVTMQGASLSLPLRMAAVGTGAKVGLSIWVVAEGRYEPQNFPVYRIEDSELSWDFSKSASNYTDLRAQNDLKHAGRGWELQSSITLNRQTITSLIENGGNGGFQGGLQGPTSDYLAIAPEGQSSGKTAEQVRAEDIAGLFAGMAGSSVRVTRVRGDIAKTAMNVDFLLHASPDQAEISNVHNLTKYVNLQCPVYNHCAVDGFAATPEEAATRTAANTNNSGAGLSCSAGPSHTTRDLGVAGIFGAAGLALTVARAWRRRKNSEE